MSSCNKYTVPGKGDLCFYWVDQEIWASNTISTLTAQELIDAIRTVEDSTIGITNTKIADAAGKDSLGGDIYIGITLTLLENWVIYSEKTSGFFTIRDGNIIRHDATTPFKSNTSITYQQVLIQGGVITQTNAGSGLSTEEHNQLMGLSTATATALEVWNTGTAAQTWSVSSFATRILNLLTKNSFISGT
jgi:hypothetical protein